MKEDQFGETRYLNCYEKYNKTELHKLFGELYDQLDKAEQAGFTEVHVVFESTIDPYEPYPPGPVEVTVAGQRELRPEELEEEEVQHRIYNLAAKLGITFYEASVVDRLEKAKKVKL